MNKISRWLWGLVLIALGVILGVNALGIVEINIFFPGWWTLFIIVPCFIGLFDQRDGNTADLIGLIIGVCLLLGCLGILRFDLIWKMIVPVILVVVGVVMIMKDTVSSKVMKKVKETNRHKENEYWATFCGQKLDFKGEEFRGCTLEAVFGGLRCDLNGAIIKEDVMIKASGIFGGVTIIVPDDMEVKVVSNSIFGGVENKRANRDGRKSDKKEKPVVYVEATCVFGGVEVR